MSEQTEQWVALAGVIGVVFIVASMVHYLIRNLREDEDDAVVREATASWVQEWVFDAHPMEPTHDEMRAKRGIVRRARRSVG